MKSKNINKMIFPAVVAAGMAISIVNEVNASTQISIIENDGTMTPFTALIAATTEQRYNVEVGSVVTFDNTAVAAASYKYVFAVSDQDGKGGEVIFFTHNVDPFGSSIASATYSGSAYTNFIPTNLTSKNIDLCLVADSAVGQSNSCIGIDPSKWRSVNIWSRVTSADEFSGLIFNTANSNAKISGSDYNIRMPFRWSLPKSFSYGNADAYAMVDTLLQKGFKTLPINAKTYDTKTQKTIPLALSSYNPTTHKTVPLDAGTVQLSSDQFYDFLDELIGGRFPELTKLKVATPAAIAAYLQTLMVKH